MPVNALPGNRCKQDEFATNWISEAIEAPARRNAASRLLKPSTTTAVPIEIDGKAVPPVSWLGLRP